MAIETQLYPSNAAGFPFCGSQGMIIDNIQSCFNSQQHHLYNLKHQQQLAQQQQQQQQQLCNQRQILYHNMSAVDPNLLFLSNSNAYGAPNNIQHLTPNSQRLAVEFDAQRDEIGHYIRSQNEKLRILLQEQRKQQVEDMLKKVELDAFYVLRQKDEQIAQATKKRVELEEFLTRLEAENECWRRVAQENEAMVLSLNNTLEQIKERASFGMGAEDAESCCERREEETGENGLCYGGVREDEQISKKAMVCKCCNSGSSCFMFLPCRHLCCCKNCEVFLKACPVCRTPKKSSIETLIF